MAAKSSQYRTIDQVPSLYFLYDGDFASRDLLGMGLDLKKTYMLLGRRKNLSY